MVGTLCKNNKFSQNVDKRSNHLAIETRFQFTTTTWSYSWHEFPVMCKNNFVHSLGLGKMQPTKLDKRAIQIDFSSQLSDKRKSIEMQILIIKTKILTWTKNITSDIGTVEFEQQRHGELSLLFTSKTKLPISASTSSLWFIGEKYLTETWIETRLM